MDLTPPVESDIRHGLGKVAEMGVSAIPVIGGPLGVALADRLARPYQRRMDEFLNDVAVALNELRARVGDFDDLAKSEAFLDAVAAGTRIAERSRREKRELLRNAVLNTALATDPDEDQQHVFFDLIDRLPPVALRLLKFVSDPQYRHDVIGHDPQLEQLVLIGDIARWLSPMQDGDDVGAMAAFVDKQGKRLQDEGLLGVGALSEAGYQNEHEYFAHHVRLGAISRFGRSFLAFIEDPRGQVSS
jgi:hypothetical protein